MRSVKSYCPYIIGFFLIASMAPSLKAQNRPTEVKFPTNFSCGQTKLLDLDGNLKGWLVVADVTSQEDDLQMRTQHLQRVYLPEDAKKIDDYCLQIHKQFNLERDRERKRVLKLAQSHKKETPKQPRTEKIDLTTASR